MNNSFAGSLHIGNPDIISVRALFSDPAAPALAHPDTVYVTMGDGVPSLVLSPIAAAELAKQLTAHLAGLARRENLAQAKAIAEGGA
jgi:hypothetical protein